MFMREPREDDAVGKAGGRAAGGRGGGGGRSSVVENLRKDGELTDDFKRKAMQARDIHFQYMGKKYLIYQTNQSDKVVGNELAMLRSLKPYCNPFVVCFVDSFKSGGTHYIVSDGIDSKFKTLSSCLESGTWFLQNISKIQSLFKNLIHGLDHIHRMGVASVTMNPENVLVNLDTSQIRYMGFGDGCEAMSEHCETHRNIIYSAPESLTIGKTFPFTVAKQLDIWALGMLICICLEYYDFEIRDYKLTQTLTRMFSEGQRDPFNILHEPLVVKAFLKYGLDVDRLLNLDPTRRSLQLDRQFKSNESIKRQIESMKPIPAVYFATPNRKRFEIIQRTNATKIRAMEDMKSMQEKSPLKPFPKPQSHMKKTKRLSRINTWTINEEDDQHYDLKWKPKTIAERKTKKTKEKMKYGNTTGSLKQIHVSK